jgi:hypothetical protein
MGVGGVRHSKVPVLTDVAGGPSLRDQHRANERKVRDAEAAELAKAKPADRPALVAAHREASAERARTFATMVCSAPGHKYATPGANNTGQILKAFYALIGERGREQAAREKKPFSAKDVERVRLSKDDVHALREQLMKEGFSDADFQKALPLLHKHIARDRFLDRAAMAFMKSTGFVAFKAAIEQMIDAVDRQLDAHQRKLDEGDHALLLEHLRDVEKRGRRVTSFTDTVVVANVDKNGDGADDQRQARYAVVGGKLVPVDEH